MSVAPARASREQPLFSPIAISLGAAGSSAQRIRFMPSTTSAADPA